MADNLPPTSVDAMESVDLNLPEPSGPHRPVMGMIYLLPTAFRPNWDLLICMTEGQSVLNSRSHIGCPHSAKIMAHSITAVCIMLLFLCVFPGNIAGLVTGVYPEERGQESE
jgi:hypothetical protein